MVAVVAESAKDAMIDYLTGGLNTCVIRSVEKCLIVESDAPYDYDIDTYEGLYVKKYASGY